MTTLPNNQSAVDSRFKEIEEENELLLLQLHQVQEELEHYFFRNQELEKGLVGAPQGKGWVDDELPEALAEVQRLSTIVTVQANVRQLEAENALNAKLGDILIQGTESPAKLIGVPGKILKIWRQASQGKPSAALGGQSFAKVIEVFGNGGFESVEELLALKAITPAIKGNAYTALARHLLTGNAIQAAEAARLAYSSDPRPYRLKWLACRLHDAGNLLEADAMLDLLPKEIQISDSESRQISQIRYEAKNARLRQAKQETGFSERRASAERQLSSITRERDEQARLAAERQAEIVTLKQIKRKLEQEKTDLNSKYTEQAKIAVEMQSEFEVLKTKQSQLQKEKYRLDVHLGEQLKITRNQSAQIESLNKERAKLQAQLDEAKQENDLLLQQLCRVQEDLENLLLENQEQASLLTERQVQIDALQQSQTQLEQDKTDLAARCDEQVRVLSERDTLLAALQQSQTQLEQDKTDLAARCDEQARVLSERETQIDALQHCQRQLEQEKAALTKHHNEQEKLALKRQEQLNDLEQQIQHRQATNVELSSRQQLMQEEIVRAESQLELIKDLFFRESDL